VRNCLIMDLDDTLFPEYEYVRSGFKAVDDYLVSNHGLVGFLEKANEIFESGERGDIFNQYLDSMSINYDEKFIITLVNIYRHHKPEISLYKDAVWVFSQFARTHRFGLITDGWSVTQKNKIAALGIKQKFNSIVITDELGPKYWKPHKKPYLLTQKKLNTTGCNCIYVGDNPKKDFVTPKKLGWLTVQVKRDRGEYKDLSVKQEYCANFEIASLFELESIIKN